MRRLASLRTKVDYCGLESFGPLRELVPVSSCSFGSSGAVLVFFSKNSMNDATNLSCYFMILW